MIGIWKNIQIFMKRKKNDFAFPGLVWFVLHMSEIVRERVEF